MADCNAAERDDAKCPDTASITVRGPHHEYHVAVQVESYTQRHGIRLSHHEVFYRVLRSALGEESPLLRGNDLQAAF